MPLTTLPIPKNTSKMAVLVALAVSLVWACSSKSPASETPNISPVSTPLVSQSSFISPLATTADFRSSSHPALAGRILYHSDLSGNFDVYVMAADGSSHQRLTNSSGDDVEAVWSPDESKIAFSSNRDGNYEVYVMEADGSNQRRLTHNLATDWGPTWSPDGNRIAFASEKNGEMYLFVMNVDGTDQHSLVPETEIAGWAPKWSPTRNEIVFVSDRDGDSDLYLLQLESATVVPLTSNDHRDERPAWSPDGNQIVFMGAKENTALFDPDEIYIIPRLGGETRQLTDNLIGDITPTWSPDGYWIAFSSSRNGGWNIFVTPAAGEQEVLQLTHDKAWNRAPCWGP